MYSIRFLRVQFLTIHPTLDCRVYQAGVEAVDSTDSFGILTKRRDCQGKLSKKTTKI